MSANAWMVKGHVVHRRLLPISHDLDLPVTSYLFDIDQLPLIRKHTRGLGEGFSSLMQLRDKDYVEPKAGTLREKLKPFVALQEDQRVLLLTHPKVLGYVFNPVNFYLVLDHSDRPTALVAEVNNTFKDRHIYTTGLTASEGDAEKVFHVSPFNNLEGNYQFRVHLTDREVSVTVDLYRNGEKILETWIEGRLTPLTPNSLLYEWIKHPIRPWMTMPRILWHAAILHFGKKMKIYKRPEPTHLRTVLRRKQPRTST